MSFYRNTTEYTAAEPFLSITLMAETSRRHGLHFKKTGATVSRYREFLSRHLCADDCVADRWLFRRPLVSRVNPFGRAASIASLSRPPPVETRPTVPAEPPRFPPLPASLSLKAKIVREWVEATSAKALAEAVCAVCARRVQANTLVKLPAGSPYFSVLTAAADVALPDYAMYYVLLV